jgi:hypothetical protein
MCVHVQTRRYHGLGMQNIGLTRCYCEDEFPSVPVAQIQVPLPNTYENHSSASPEVLGNGTTTSDHLYHLL